MQGSHLIDEPFANSDQANRRQYLYNSFTDRGASTAGKLPVRGPIRRPDDSGRQRSPGRFQTLSLVEPEPTGTNVSGRIQ